MMTARMYAADAQSDLDVCVHRLHRCVPGEHPCPVALQHRRHACGLLVVAVEEETWKSTIVEPGCTETILMREGSRW
jgi:hypothetical protein